MTALRRIVCVPHEALRSRAEEVTNIDDDLRSLARDMAAIMYAAPGVGLAANQVGDLRRIIVADVQYSASEPHNKIKRPIFVINPELSAVEGACVREEGCLSVPEFALEIQRAERAHVRGVDLDGNPLEMDVDGLLARVFQHEIDHLNGTTILDRASVLKRRLYTRKMKKKARRD
jgi:peptide deformylase